MKILAGSIRSTFQDFESCLRTKFDLFEDDIRLVLDKKNSSFITFELTPGIYTFKDFSEALFNLLQPEYPRHSNVIDIEFDDIVREIKLVVSDGMDGIIAIRFDGKSFSSTILGLNPHWDYKHYNEDMSQKIVNLSSTNKKHLKCDVFVGSVINGLRQPILYSFVLDKPAGYKEFCEPETILYKKVIKCVLNTITFYSEDDDIGEFKFNGETLTFTLQMIKI